MSRSGAPFRLSGKHTIQLPRRGVQSFPKPSQHPLSRRAEAPAQKRVPLSPELPEQEGAERSLDMAQDALYLFLHKAWYLAFPSPSWDPP